MVVLFFVKIARQVEKINVIEIELPIEQEAKVLCRIPFDGKTSSLWRFN